MQLLLSISHKEFASLGMRIYGSKDNFLQILSVTNSNNLIQHASQRNPWSQASSHKPMPWPRWLDAYLQLFIIMHKTKEVIGHVLKWNLLARSRGVNKFLPSHQHEIHQKHNDSTFQVQIMVFQLTCFNEAIWGTWVFFATWCSDIWLKWFMLSTNQLILMTIIIFHSLCNLILQGFTHLVTSPPPPFSNIKH